MPYVDTDELTQEGYVNPPAEQLPPPPDVYTSYQNWLNTLNPATAPSARSDDGYASPTDWEALRNRVFSPPSGTDIAAGKFGHSYISPDVDPWGRTISPQIKDERDYKFEEDANRARGMMEYQALVRDGATNEEAFRKTAGLLFWQHPDKLAQALARVPGPETPFAPVIEEVEGGRILRTSPRGAKFIRDLPEKMPQAVADERKLIEGQIRAFQNDKYGMKRPKPGEMEELESRYRELGTNWMTRPPEVRPMADAPTQPISAPPPAEEPAQPRTKAELEALPKGSRFVNPADGKVYVKK